MLKEGKPQVPGWLAETDEEGFFALADLIAGPYRFMQPNAEFEIVSEVDFTLAPGEQHSSLTIAVKRRSFPE
jgi:hypothetical protein